MKQHPFVLGAVLVLALGLWPAASAQACTPLLPYDFETGREFNWHHTPKPVFPHSLVRDGTQVAVIRTKLIRQQDAKYGDHRENVLRHIVEETLTPGPITIDDRAYPLDPNIKETRMEPSFFTWHTARINSPKTRVGTGSDSCGRNYEQLSLQPGGRYLAFITTWGDEFRVDAAAPIDTGSDPIVTGYRKAIAGAPDAPNRMSAQQWFSHMQDYIELEVMHCPTEEEMRFTDSLYGTKEKQLGAVYRLGDRTRDPQRPFDLRYAISYRQQVRGGSSRVGYPLQDCQFGDRWLYVAPAKGNGRSHYLRLENGRIDTSEIGTRITITGPDAVLASDVKSWIRDARASD